MFNKGILGILNSKLIFWFYRNENNEFDNLFPKIKSKEIKALPIVEDDLSVLDIPVSKIEILTKEFLVCQNKFVEYFQSQFSIEKLSKKLKNWHRLEFGDFTKELNYAIKKAGGDELNDKAKFNLMSLFKEQQAEAERLKNQIDQTDNEINQRVYELYNLTKEEVEIVENS